MSLFLFSLHISEGPELVDIEEGRKTRNKEVKQPGQRRQLVGLEHLLSPLEVVLNTLQTISHLTNTEERAFSDRRLFLPGKKPLKGKRRRRKFPVHVKKRAKQTPRRPQFGPLKARDPGEPSGAGVRWLSVSWNLNSLYFSAECEEIPP